MPAKKKSENIELAQPNESFEEQLKKLDELVVLMEAGGLPLAHMIEKYEEGMALQKALQKQLDDVKGRLTELRSENGALVEAEIDINMED